MDWSPLLQLVNNSGPVVVAMTLLGVGIYAAYRFMFTPSQKMAKQIANAHADAARSNADAAKDHAEAARCNSEASKFNAQTSEQNAKTAEHLNRLTEMVMQQVFRPKA